MNRTVKIKRIKKKKEVPKIKPKIILKTKPKLKPIKKTGFWCDYYPGRLPFPIECSYNKSSPIEYIFIQKERKCVKNFPKCPNCNRSVSWEDWKKGKWNNVIQEIKKGADLRNHPIPFKKDYED
jgi:hypothetical protein